MAKLNLKDIVSKMKAGIKASEKPAPKPIPINPATRQHRIRDMRQEAIDLGSHQAKEIFGESNQ